MSKNGRIKLIDWLDIRNHNFVRIATVSPTVVLGNPMANAQNHLDLFQIVYDRGAQVAIGSECGLTGYTIWDLVDQEAVMDKQEEALIWLLEYTLKLNLILVVGGYLNVGSSRYNVAFVLLRGKILAIIPKSYLASSGEFRDERWVKKGRGSKGLWIDYAEQENIPFGTDILVKAKHIKHFIFAVQICQDLWVPVPPSTRASLNGATICATINASPEIIGKEEYQRAMNNFWSATNYSVMVYCSSGIGESSTDLVFAGRMIISQNNQTLVSADRFDDNEPQWAIADVDLHAVVHDRRNDPSWQDCADEYADAYRVIPFDGKLGTNDVGVFHRLVNHPLDKLPFVPNDPTQRHDNAVRIFDMQVAAFQRRLLALPESNRRPIVAVSGGSDSALALLVAAKTMDKMGLSRSNIIAITMPGFGTTDTTYSLAVELIKSIGAEFKEISIKELTTLALQVIGHDLVSEDLTFENAQAWIRKLIEWLNASFYHGVVLGTGDLSELILGWCTFAGDHMSHYNPNANLAKTAIWFMLETLGELYAQEDPTLAALLMAIRNLLPSPELLRPNSDGSMRQISEDKNGKYVFQDFNIYHMLRWGDAPVRLAWKMYQAYDHALSLEEITNWLTILVKQFFKSQFKRSTLPDGVLVGTIGVSPRDKMKIPSDADNTVWLDNIQQIPPVA